MTENQKHTPDTTAARESRAAWETPELRRVGHVGEVLQTGPGKLSPTGGDTGEMRQEKTTK